MKTHDHNPSSELVIKRRRVLSSILFFILFVLAVCNASAETVRFESGNNAESLPFGLIFRVAVPGSEEVTEKSINEYGPVSIKSERSEYGIWNDYLRACKAKLGLIALGYEAAEIIAYFNKHEVSLPDAFLILDNRNSFEEEKTATISIQEMDSLVNIAEHKFYAFSLCVNKNDKVNCERLSKLSVNLQERKDASGQTLLSFGNFNSVEEAKTYSELLKSFGVQNVRMIAWDAAWREIKLLDGKATSE